MTLRALRQAHEPIDGASLAAFRISFGLLMAGYCVPMLRPEYLRGLYVQPQVQFTYLGFDWIQRLPLMGLLVVTGVLLLAAISMACGFYQRLAAATFFVGWTYFFLLEKAYYINHFYLVSLLMMLFVIMPGNGAFTSRWAGYPSTKVPRWCLWTIRSQFAILYFYAGLAKIQRDWIAGEPMRTFLAPYFDSAPSNPTLLHDSVAYALSWGGLTFDLLLVPALLWPRTRIVAILFAAGFHLTNHALFNIGFFPWLSMAGALLFFPPEWPRRVLKRLNVATSLTRAQTARIVLRKPNRLLIPFLCFYFVVQLVVPFQRFLYPGNAHWTEEGQKYSWLLMMKHKVGDVDFTVVNLDTGKRTRIIEERYMNAHQRHIMSGDPDMLLQFAHHLAAEESAKGNTRVTVYADAEVAFNGHRKQKLVPPDLDLASVERSWGHYSWIVTLEPDR